MNISQAYETIQCHLAERVAKITLNRPDTLNAINVTMIQELNHCLKELAANEHIQIVVLQGNGKGFSSGGDIKSMLASNHLNFDDVMDQISELALRLFTLPKFVIAAIHGAAAGLGFSLALNADRIIAEKDSKFAMNFIGIGLIPDGGGHYLLAQRVGVQKAKEIIWEGRVMPAEDAYLYGLVDELVEGDLQAYVDQYVKQLLRTPLLAKIETKRLMAEWKKDELQHILKREKEGQRKMRQTKDHLEGIQAFLEKRMPQFHGR
jgi:2-(1,2-epoxy-1,2-dihydrophenyl)acetyl-CoA isomerase